MRIFVTGATGFLGSHLCSALREHGEEVVGVGSSECDLRSSDNLDDFKHHSFDQIYHLAAWTQAGDFCLHHPGEQWLANQLINTTILNWWHKHQPQAKLIAIGSSCCYQPGRPHAEEEFLQAVPIDTLFTYAMTKKMLYVGLEALARQFGHRYLFLVPATLYGPGYHLDGRQMHFIFDLMRKIANGRFKGEKVTLWGDGSQKRELVHVLDFVRAAMRLAATSNNE